MNFSDYLRAATSHPAKPSLSHPEGPFTAMDQTSQRPESAARAPARAARALSLVASPLRLAHPNGAVPGSWSAALAGLGAWLGVEIASVPAPDAAAPVFAPWEGWSPAAFQNGGAAGLPEAQFVASYCLDHGHHARGAVDLVLLSPHPALCGAGGADAAPLAGALRAMIRVAVAEGRGRIAIICHAAEHAALERFRLAEERSLVPDGVAVCCLAIEDALPALMGPGAPWDAVIAMPDLRGIVFTLLSETSGVRGAWPMLWHSHGLRRVTCEVRGEGSVRLPLDAPALVQTLALALQAAGKTAAAQRLHARWADLRESGVTTLARGSAAPYATELSDPDLIAMISRENTSCKPARREWQALKSQPMINFGGHLRVLRVVSSKTANH